MRLIVRHWLVQQVARYPTLDWVPGKTTGVASLDQPPGPYENKLTPEASPRRRE